MRYFILAGEASGDLHGARLAEGLRKADPNADMHGWGGDQMAAAGVAISKHYRELAFMGFLEVVKNLPEILGNFRTIKRQITELQPDALILIDYPGFNLRMAKWAAEKGLRVFYFISPQLWAWHTSRAKQIGRYVERMYVILPFEKDFYASHGIEVDYFGHPLAERLQGFKPDPDFHQKYGLDPGVKTVALLPGSRRQEIRRMLPVMLSIKPDFPHVQFAIAGAPALERAFYQPFLEQHPWAHFIPNDTYNLLANSAAAMVTSGTATLETALCGVPQVICYKANRISYQLAKMLVNKDLRHIGIVNLIAGREIVPELIQDEFTAERLKEELWNLLELKTYLRINKDYEDLKKQLQGENPAGKVAGDIVSRLRSEGKATGPDRG
ncbi:MAG: lipid-A-disaccharide synthase [Saprospiraceae bacterium]